MRRNLDPDLPQSAGLRPGQQPSPNMVLYWTPTPAKPGRVMLAATCTCTGLTSIVVVTFINGSEMRYGVGRGVLGKWVIYETLRIRISIPRLLSPKPHFRTFGGRRTVRQFAIPHMGFGYMHMPMALPMSEFSVARSRSRWHAPLACPRPPRGLIEKRPPATR